MHDHITRPRLGVAGLVFAALTLSACGARPNEPASSAATASAPAAADQVSAATSATTAPSATAGPTATPPAGPSLGPVPTFDTSDLTSLDDELQQSQTGLGSAAASGSEGNLK